ncbi:MAG TPA: Flp family type IVb pilin [Solimonas sp.]
MMQSLKQFLRDEEGASAVEYGLIVGLIAVAAVVVLLIIGPQLTSLFQSTSDSLTQAGAAPGGGN